MRDRRLARTLIRAIPHVLLIGIVLTLLVVFKQWAHVATYRLYLDHRVDEAADSTATQRFDLEGARVVPRIVMRDDRMAFRAAVGRDATILAQVTPATRASYEIHVRQDGADRVAASGEVTGPTSVVCPLPTGRGVIELVSHGELTWSDLRLQGDFQVHRQLWVLAFLLACSLVWILGRRARAPAAAPARPSRGLAAWLATLTVFVSIAISALIMEGALRAVGTRLSSGLSAARRNLGELMEDPRWQPTRRYGRRLKVNVDEMNYWRHGDIVRMGFIPPGVSEGLGHRYSLRTDAEGFRNSAPRDDIEVAALGDSFTDALTMPIEAAWTSQLERLIGLPVQNYGTAGFGPQQELLVLEDYVARHHPGVVVVAFFAGNDIGDAEAFEHFELAGGVAEPPTFGWPIKSIVSRADTWYVMNAIQAAATTLYPEPPADQTPRAGSPASVPAGSHGFDRGMFTVSVNGATLRWAFMPPYLKQLRFSEQDLAARRGWTLTRESLIAMQGVSRGVGAELVLMFLPFKSQVYLPLLERTFSRDDLAAAFRFYLGGAVGPSDLTPMSRNRLAPNILMKRFCDEAGIPFLDVTGVLQTRVEAGENMYFPDDSHLNEAGALVVAARLAAFLQERGLVGGVGFPRGSHGVSIHLQRQ